MKTRQRLDIERLLQWAFVELAKSGTTAWSPWDALLRLARLGTRVDDQFGPEFRLPAAFGDCHPDAKVIGHHVDRLGSPAAALVTLHAKLNSRPKALGSSQSVFPVMDGSRYRVVGKSYGRSSMRLYGHVYVYRLYYEGAYCPLRYSPTTEEIADSRAEYTAWREGLVLLVGQLRGQLTEHEATGPTAPAKPWDSTLPPARVLRSVFLP